MADNYIALFSHFIPCGVWEAVYIIEGLLKQRSDADPDTIHADTQGQSYPVHALAHLFGFELLDADPQLEGADLLPGRRRHPLQRTSIRCSASPARTRSTGG